MRAIILALAVSALLTGGSQAQENTPQVDIPPHPTLPECQPDDPTLLKPDLVPDTPSDVRTLVKSYYRQMEFTTAIGNIGPGPLILEGLTISNANGVFTAAYQHINRTDGTQCAHTAGLFVYHPEHKHWHFDRFVGYELRRDDPYTGELVAGGEKASFCLLDIQSLRGFNPLNFPRQVMTQTCNSAEGIYGISVGWEDVYEHFLPGQSINLDPDPQHQVPEGTYFLVNWVNPDGKIWEANLKNNTSFVSVGVNLPPPVLHGTPPPTPMPGAPRNPQLPHLRPGRVRPTRPPRPGAPAPTPTRTRPVAPTPTPTLEVAATPTPTMQQSTGRGPHQPHAPSSANLRPQHPIRPPRAPRPGSAQPTPTSGATGGPPVATSCDNACSYDISQLRLTWYDALGLQVQGFVDGTAAACPRLPDASTSGTFQMVNWLNQSGQNLGFDHSVNFVLDDSGDGATSDGGDFSVNAASNGVRFTYKADLPPPARTSSGFAGTPVVFDGCMILGGNAVKMRLVCQPHSTGLLCHEG